MDIEVITELVQECHPVLFPIRSREAVGPNQEVYVPDLNLACRGENASIGREPNKKYCFGLEMRKTVCIGPGKSELKQCLMNIEKSSASIIVEVNGRNFRLRTSSLKSKKRSLPAQERFALTGRLQVNRGAMTVSMIDRLPYFLRSVV